jgi:hypothetical protein
VESKVLGPDLKTMGIQLKVICYMDSDQFARACFVFHFSPQGLVDRNAAPKQPGAQTQTLSRPLEAGRSAGQNEILGCIYA